MKEELVHNNEAEAFFCELTGGCSNNTNNINETTYSTGSEISNTVVSGKCGSAYKKVFHSIPMADLCAQGIASSVYSDGSSAWAWRCQ